MNTRPLVSLVIPVYNEESVLPMLRKALIGLANRLEGEKSCEVEIVLVDDGSSDGSWVALVQFAQTDPRVRAFSFTRNFGHQAALSAGYALARGDAVVTMDADLQDPPEVVLELVDAWKNGADIVYAVRTHREGESWFKLWSAHCFYRLMQKIADTRSPRNAGDFRLLNRRAVEALNQLQERHRYLRGMVGWLGFSTAIVNYERKRRPAGSTKYPLFKMVRLAFDAIISFSTFPLRLFYILGVLSTVPFIAYAGYALFLWYFMGVPMQPGWMALMLSIITFGSLNLFCLGIMGEYVGRVYEQGKGRPLFLIREQTAKDPTPSYDPAQIR